MRHRGQEKGFSRQTDLCALRPAVKRTEGKKKRIGRNSVSLKSGEGRARMGGAGVREGGRACGLPVFPAGRPYLWQSLPSFQAIGLGVVGLPLALSYHRRPPFSQHTHTHMHHTTNHSPSARDAPLTLAYFKNTL